jgi:hypothetical protein
MPREDYVPSKRSGLIGRLFSSTRGILSRFFARKSPGNFDEETGSWVDPDVILTPDPDAEAPPEPLVNNDCKQSHVVYSVVVNTVPACNAATKLQALGEAIAKAIAYFNDHFECRNKNCIRKVGEIIWTGMACSQNGTRSWGAVLVRFRCEVEL